MLLLLAACAPTEQAVAFTEADMLAAIDGYAGWAEPPGWEGLAPSCTAAHGSYVHLRLDATAAEDEAAGAARHSDGATYVVEGFQDAEGTAKMVAAMRKTPGYAPDTANWYWAWLDESGSVVTSGDLPSCTHCHADATGYVWHASETRPATIADCGGRDTGFWYE